jgi:hypothetical protein
MTGSIQHPSIRPPSALAPAPRRNLLTKTMGHGASPVAAMPFAPPITFLIAIPIEAPCYAARLGFVNMFNFPVVISGASIYTSDSYSACADMTGDETSGKWFLRPTGAALTGTRVTFDCRGSPNPASGSQFVNDSGAAFSFTLPADPTNTNNAAKPVTLQWSDFVPVTSIPQRKAPDGPHILFIYVTIGSPGMVHGCTNWLVMARDPTAMRRRQYYGAVAANEAVDYNTNPTGTGFQRYELLPQFALQYLTPSFGIQCVTVGDSLTAAPAEDLFSTSVWRAAADLSNQTLPIEIAPLQFSGPNSTAYNVSLQNNVAAIRPSVLFCQPLSRNDGPTIKTLQTLLARSLAYGHELNSLYGTRLVLNSPGCEPSFDGNPSMIAAFNDIRARLQAIGADGVIPHIDGPSVLGLPDAPWKHIPGLTDDIDHPNAAGAELLVPLTTQALRSVTGI